MRRTHRSVTVALTALACLALGSPAYAGDEYGDCSETAGYRYSNVHRELDAYKTVETIMITNNDTIRQGPFTLKTSKDTTTHAHMGANFQTEIKGEANWKIFKAGIKSTYGVELLLDHTVAAGYEHAGSVYVEPGRRLYAEFEHVHWRFYGDRILRNKDCTETVEPKFRVEAGNGKHWDIWSEPAPPKSSNLVTDDEVSAVEIVVVAGSVADVGLPDTLVSDALPGAEREATATSGYAEDAADDGTDPLVFVDLPEPIVSIPPPEAGADVRGTLPSVQTG